MTMSNRDQRSSNSFWAVLRNRDFRLLWAAGGLDNSGRWMDTVVMGLLVLGLTDSAFQVALLFVFRWTPMLLFALVSGMVADRADRWMVMIVARGLTVAVTATLLVLTALDAIEPWHLFLGSLALGWLFVLEFPSRRSFIYDLVGTRQLIGAMSMETINFTIGRLSGPFAAGVVIQVYGFTPAYILLTAIYGLAFVFTVLIEARIPAPAIGPFSFWSTVAAGVRYSLGNQMIRSLLGFTLIMNAMAFSVESLFPVVARDHLGVGAGLTGLLISAQAIGTLVGATIIGLLAIIRYQGRIFCLGLLLQFSSLLLFALSPWYPLSFLLLLFSGVGAAGFSTMQSTIVMISATGEMRGSALGVLGQCIGIAAVGGVVVGAVADILSARAAVGLSTGLGLALLIPLMPFSPLARRPITSPDTPTGPDGSTASEPT